MALGRHASIPESPGGTRHASIEESPLEIASMPYDKIKDPNFTIRPAKGLDEIREVWWPFVRDLGWNRGFNDTTTIHHLTQPSGFLIAANKSDDKGVGCVVPFSYQNETGWVGYFITDASVRGKGWGGALFVECMDHFRSHNISIVGLDGVSDQVRTYERRGFKETARIKIVSRPSLADKPLEEKEGMQTELDKADKLVPLSEVPAEWLAESDAGYSGFKRPALWSKEGMFDREDKPWGYAIVSRKYNALLAWTLVRQCHDGYRVGPLYADTPGQASLLLQAVMKDERTQEKGKGLVAEAYGPNERALGVFKQLGWEEAPFEYHRMWLDGNATPEQSKGGRAEKGMFATFDAGFG